MSFSEESYTEYNNESYRDNTSELISPYMVHQYPCVQSLSEYMDRYKS